MNSLLWEYEEMFVSSYFYSLNNSAASYNIRNLKCNFQNLLNIKLKFQNLINNPGRIPDPGKFRDFDRDRDSKK
jgi:hypothetical protein